MLSITQKNRALQAVDSLFFVVTNELCCAPTEQSAFKQLTETEVIWPKNDVDIGLVYDETKESLFRIEGHYNGEKKRWSSKHRSLVARNVRVSFTTMKAPYVTFLCTVSIDALVFSRIIIPRNRTFISRKTERVDV